jgi:hypothetical protein
MPQIWMTYKELADLYGCDTSVAREKVIANDWTRRRSRDGQTRVKLVPAAVDFFLQRVVEQYALTHIPKAICDLHALHDEMNNDARKESKAA